MEWNEEKRIAAAEPIVQFQQIGVVANGRSLLSDLSFTIQTGEFLVLLGRSGSGKTTTMKLINRLLMPTSGQVLVRGKATTDWDEIQLRRQIGYVIQETGLFPHFTIEQNVGVVPTLQGEKPQRVKARAHELLHQVGLDPAEFASRYPHQLSGGQRQRVGVARSLAADPPILLMDEPFGALDPITRMELQQEFRRLQQDLNKTVVFVTHDIQEAFILASRIGLLENGRLVELATPEAFARSPHPEAQTFLNTLRSVPPFVMGAQPMQDFFLIRYGSEIVQRTGEHLLLVGIAITIAIAISLPFGVLITRKKALRQPVLAIANILQTIPSLALFGLLIPLVGIGAVPAIIALTVYSFLPIIRNTYTGIMNVDPAVREAGRGMGMTDWQLLSRVELPLALGVILAGVRVAVVIAVGIATIAAAIGAGGLGVFIFRGIAVVNNQLILAGAVPAAAIALIADYGIGALERQLTIKR